MADDNWQKVREIFDSALQYKPAERRKFVHEACGFDKNLFAEVESLLSSLDSADKFMETPAVAAVANVIEAETKRLATGKCFGHYEIIEQIGAGGMGEVYLANDKKLDRQVAVKILKEKFNQDESSLSRFTQEAKTASALNHPNILVIHEIGESGEAHYIVSEYIKGATLREILKRKSLNSAEILDISIQIADALSAAHEAGLIHRDIKPENIMIRPDGYVKILDFGLAKLVEQKNKSILGLENDVTKQNQTAKGVIMGTVNYMSPEQAKGERVDERTDIFSFGAVIYEMIAGKTPFAGDSVSETFANLINQEPQATERFAADVPAELQRVVLKMLRKDKTDRFQTMKALSADLKNLRENLSLEAKSERSALPENGNETAILRATTGDANFQTVEAQSDFSQRISKNKPLAAFALIALLVGIIGLGYYFFAARKTTSGDKKSIAVLPLKPINTANRDELYEVGIADSLINKLSAMKGFIVRPLSATRQYAEINQDALAAGKAQQVDYVLASNYQLAGGKVRVTAQLFNVISGQVEETYKSEKDAGDLFKMQDAIAGEVGDILLARFATTTSSSSTAARGTTNEEAYRLYLQGMYLYDKRNQPDARKAIEFLDEAVRLAPNYALAWAGLAHAHRYAGNLGRDTDTHEEYRKSIEAINRALALDANLSEAHSALCENKLYYEYDFDGAERECKRAIELDNNSSMAHEIYSRYLTGRGRRDEAMSEIKTAIALEPTSFFNQRNYGIILYQSRRLDEAAAQFKQVIATEKNSGSTALWLISALALQGKEAEAFEWFMKLRTSQQDKEETLQIYRTAFQTSGWQGVLREQIKGFDKTNQFYYFGAYINAQIGDKDKAFEYLEKSYLRHEWAMATLKVDPRLDPLRGDPRFDQLIGRVESK